MKIAQLQKSIITDLTKRRPERWSLGRYDERAVLVDGYRMHIIDGKDLFINPERLGALSGESVDAILRDHRAGGLQDLTYISSHRGEHRAGDYDLYSCDGFEVAVNPAYLKYFEGFTLKGAGASNPVYVYELDELVGLVMPIRRAI